MCIRDRIICERKKIKALIEDSLFDTFILINRNTMINYKFIDELSENIKLSNGEEFVYSKRRRNEIYNKFLYLRRDVYKRQGYTNVANESGETRKANVHWFEEETIGIKEIYIKGWSKK